ncbi:hypothetical protein KIN20_005488 [Parelaphostrongylus tenuis]|uniref:Protein transport protein sec16 n=1 Tax=Parelaphostrongylus tenuis TaxID=148309 RepID=A0AAD5M284_PARTN|nr:hypothetical protein KIN20_005488 [Parelaphostrongylus tenuis]
MQDEYYSRRLEESQKAYEGSSQQLLLSDVERDNVDDTSERGGIDDNHDGRTSEISSADSIQRAPPKHRVPHAFVTFGPGGKMVTVRADSSMSLVQIDDIRTVISDPHTVRLIDCAQSFKGPLLIGQTPTNSVRLYIERQIQLLQNLDVLCENTSSNDVTDCLLIWQLLGVIVQQQGRVTGPDLARLLVRASSASSRTSSSTSQNCLFHERGATPSDSTSTASRSVKNVIVKDTSAYERFTELLLGGHITEAIDSAVGDGFFADAMVLARRLLGDDVAKLAEIEERFIATRPQCHPVVTLLSVSSKKPVPIIMNPIGDDSGGWRTHAAIILANLTSSEAMQTVYDLGKALVKHDYNCAADFCFLAVAVLSGVNPFKPDSTSIDQCESRQHISLIHASIPGRYSASLKCRYGFSLADFHATEIFDYAIRLSNISGYSPLGECIEYQRKRIQYAHLIADFGGFTTDAFRYCTEVARAIWNYYHLLPDDVLNDLCDLANRLRYVASANDSEVLWIAHLRSMIEQKKQFHCSEVPQCDFVTSQQLPQASLPVPTDHCVSVNAESTDGGTFRHELSLTPRHAQLQDPVQMSSSASCSSVMSAESEDSRESALRQRFPSSANHHGYNSDEHMIPVDEPQPYATTPPHLEAHLQASVDELSSNSCYTSAQSITEDSITRTSGRQSKDSPIAQHTPLNNFQNITQIPLSSLSAAPVYQPHVHSAQQNISSGQSNGLSDNIKKNDSSHRSKGFLGNLKEKLMKAIPNGDEMILPDDSEPTIVWDPVKGRYVGAGVEEEIRSAPPPIMNISNSQPSFGGLRAARTSGGSRYFNLMNHISSTNDASLLQSSASVPVMQVPTKWCFIPDMPDSERDEAAETTTTERQQQWQQHSTPN